MKRFVLFFSVIYLGITTLFAQSLSLQNAAGTIANGDTITYVTTDVNASLVSYMWVTNTSSSNVVVRVKKVILDTIPGSENYFCWTSCYLPNTYVGDTMTVRAGETNKMFSGDYDPMGHAGKSHIMYVFYNDNDPNDSIAYVAEFYAGSGVGFAQTPKVLAQAKLYPNPAKNTVVLNYSVSGTASAVEFSLRNILGSEVRHFQLLNNSGKITIDISNLENGIYFYSLKTNDKILVTRKLVIQKKDQ